jgi:hypothetical protein
VETDTHLLPPQSDDSDEDDQLAISKRWTFEWSSRRWSRLQDINFLLDGTHDGSPARLGAGLLHSTVSSESVLTDFSEQGVAEASSVHSEDSASAMPDSVSMAAISSCYQPPRDLSHYNSLPTKGRRNSQGSKSKAKEFLRRMDLMRTWGPSARQKGPGRRPALVIGAPVLQGEEPHALQVLQCTPIHGQSQSNPTTPLRSCAVGASPVSPGNRRRGPPGMTASASGDSAVSDLQEAEPKARRAAGKRGSVYLEDMELPSQGRRPEGPSLYGRSQFRSYENLMVHIPKDHKPGTFPKALSIESLAPAAGARDPELRTRAKKPGAGRDEPWAGRALSRTPGCPAAPRGSRVSVYDNVPGSHLYASTGDLIDMEKEDLFPHLDDILLHVNGLQQIVDHWSQNVLPAAEAKSQGVVRGGGDAGRIALDFEADAATEGQRTPSNGERDQVSLAELEGSRVRERRDSGVGASLTRPRR